MAVDGALAEHETVGGGAVGQSGGHESEHLGLTTAQSERWVRVAFRLGPDRDGGAAQGLERRARGVPVCGRRVLVTGHTGFKGGWMALWLGALGASVRGVALPPDPGASLFQSARIEGGLESVIADVRDAEALDRAILDFAPSVVIHMAAQPLVRQSYVEPRETFATNLMGTVNVLDALRRLAPPVTVLIITTDKVYENLEDGEPCRETDRLGGKDPYSASKACAELAVRAYHASYLANAGAAVGVARAGNDHTLALQGEKVLTDRIGADS